MRHAIPQDRLTRVFVQVAIDGIPTSAVLDSGGAYLLLHPEFAERIGLGPDGAIGRDDLVVRGLVRRGRIHRLPLTLAAELGEPLTIEATAFVPELDDGEFWPLPNYLGWHGCLDRFRHAIDPDEERVYFGALG